jgi:lipoic acid synthetase
VLDARPDVLNHNLETVERLQRPVRKAGRYDRSLAVLANAARMCPEIPTTTGLMLGLGETEVEIRQTLADIHAHGCRLLTIGQYSRRAPAPAGRARASPDEFDGRRPARSAAVFRPLSAPPTAPRNRPNARLNRAFL